MTADMGVDAVLSAIWMEILDAPTGDELTRFTDLGGTSIAAVQIASRIGEALQIEIMGVEILWENFSLAELRAAIRSRSSNRNEHS